MISVVESSIYVLFALVLAAFFLDSNHILLIFIISAYLIFLIRKSLKLFLFICMILISFYLIYQFQYHRLYKVEDHKKITCIISNIPDYKSDYVRFYCKANKNRMLIYVQSTKLNLRLGDVIEMESNIKPVKVNTIPNQFNYAKYLRSHHIAYQNYVTDVQFIRKINRLDYQLINKIQDYYETSPIKEYLLSFIIGDKKAISDEFSDHAQNLNISHLFVVSGFHVSFLYFTIIFFLKYLRITKETAEVIATLFIIFFLIINQFSTSILRAVLLIIGINFKNRHRLPIDNIQILSLIACINLLINPFILHNTGFILSYMITLILFLSRKIISNSHNRIISAYKITLVAQLFSLPVIANFTFFYNLLSVLFSPLLCLYYSFVIFPLTLVGLLLPCLSIYLKPFFSFYETLLEYLVSLSFLNINIGAFTILRNIIYYYLLYQILRNLEQQRFRKILMTLFVIVIFCYHKLSLVDEVTFLDVGQGDSIFIHSNINNCTALIDTGGGINHHPAFDVVKYLHSIQIKKIDILFITHSEIDHAGDYKYILDNFKIKTIVFNEYDASNLHSEIAISARNKKINILKVKAYNKVECGNLHFFIINPTKENNTINDNSLVLFLIFNGENYLFMGDASSDVIGNLSISSIDFLKVSHHGSKHSTSEEFIHSLKINHAVISVGKNYYNHPAKELLAILENKHITYYRTDTDGSISVKYYLSKKRIIIFYRPYNKIT